MKKNLWIIPVLLLAVVGVILFTNKNEKKEPKSKIYYLPLGDSVAEGMNEEGLIGKGYADFIKEYLEDEDRLTFYTKKFTKSGYTTENLKNDIESNKKVIVDGKEVYLQDALRDADLITLTIGANDFIHNLDLTNYTSKFENMDETKKEIDEVLTKVEDLIKIIRSYNNKQLIVTGYYNPFPNLQDHWEDLSELVEYYNNALENICLQNEVDYSNLFLILYRDTKALPNPYNIHPSQYGYELIAKELTKIIK